MSLVSPALAAPRARQAARLFGPQCPSGPGHAASDGTAHRGLQDAKSLSGLQIVWLGRQLDLLVGGKVVTVKSYRIYVAVR